MRVTYLSPLLLMLFQQNHATVLTNVTRNEVKNSSTAATSLKPAINQKSITEAKKFTTFANPLKIFSFKQLFLRQNTPTQITQKRFLSVTTLHPSASTQMLEVTIKNLSKFTTPALGLKFNNKFGQKPFLMDGECKQQWENYKQLKDAQAKIIYLELKVKYTEDMLNKTRTSLESCMPNGSHSFIQTYPSSQV